MLEEEGRAGWQALYLPKTKQQKVNGARFTSVGLQLFYLREETSRMNSASFTDLLATSPDLHLVSFYRLTCKAHGVFRVLANGVVPDTCPRCGQQALLQRARNLLCATRRPVPLVQRWKSDNADVSRHTAPPWLRRQGEIEDC